MKDYRFPLALTVHAGLLTFIGFFDGALMVAAAVSLIVGVTAVLMFIIGRDSSPPPPLADIAALKEAERQRDAALDVLHQLDMAQRVGGESLISAVADHARRVLNGADYLGRLRALETALEEDVTAAQDQAIANVTRGRS